VQQALLRALSVRKIRTLGSDQELPFDVRVIAATNVNLADKVQAGQFREDLYYRLQVLTIQTPPLRERLEDIPLLAAHFLSQALPFIGKNAIDLSIGALEKLTLHNWPGNVRELKNCLTRAAAMADGDIIGADEIRLGEETPSPPPSPPEQAAPDQETAEAPDAAGDAADLNPRQRRALSALREKDLFSRQDYQLAAGPSVPIRTAQHDLQDLVRKGLLIKAGRGPTTRFHRADFTQKRSA
jgi:DNA-binding NtrC family response regulator